jgi:DNA modification methylase
VRSTVILKSVTFCNFNASLNFQTMTVNKLILGDNLEIMKSMESESIDLIYLDPPFFSNRNYEIIWGDEGEVRSFKDRWSGGIDHYIGWLKERVEQMHRLLKPTGSIFLHCDWHADAYIRVEILDRIFGMQNFRSHILWKRSSAHSDTKQGRKAVGNITDSIYYYTKSSNYTFNPVFSAYTDDYVKKTYSNFDDNGRRWKSTDLTAPGGGAISKGNPHYDFLGINRYWRFSKENMEKLFQEGKIYQAGPGKVPRLKQYLDEMPGVVLQNLWDDIKLINAQSKERIGYPTQKPETLLDRIIRMSSNEGDTILDAFVGGGTTLIVAQKLNRRWIGIDQSVQAIKVSEYRLNAELDIFSEPFVVQLYKYDYDTLRYKNAFQFESWIVSQFGGQPNVKQRGDLGMDGKAQDGAPIQVKRSDGIGRNVIDNFHSAVQRYDKRLYDKNIASGTPIGYIIAFSFGRGAIEEVARLKNKENATIRLLTVEEIVPISKKPSISLEFRMLERDKKGVMELEFTAVGSSEAGIEFYSWDWDYNDQTGFKPEVIIDKTGSQRQKFKPGTHQIAVKVVDNDGLENIEIIRLKVNGSVEKL